MNPVLLVRAMKGYMDDGDDRIEESYQLRIITKLAGLWSIDIRSVKDEFFASRRGEPGDFMKCIRSRQSSGMPACLHIHKLKVDWKEFSSKLVDSEPFKLFRKLACGDEACVLVFPISNRTDWVIHNVDVESEAGVARFAVPAKYGPWAYALPLAQFIKEKKQEE